MLNNETLILLAVPVFFITLWCFILWLLSLFSGWRKLATRYGYQDSFQGESLRLQSARINGVNYNNVLNLGLNRQGLYISPMVLFRPFHKPLLIPWEEIIAEPHERLLIKGYRLLFRSLPGIRLFFYQNTFQRITDYLNTNVSGPPLVVYGEYDRLR